MKIFAHLSWLYATIIIIVALTISIILYPLLPRPYARKFSSWLIRLSTFYSVEVKGKEDPDVQMFMLNHQSDLDIGIMETSTGKDLAWVAKKALFDIPFFGLALKLPEDIAIERESKTSLVKLLRASKDRLNKNRVITIFPEGTRSTTGKMLPFKMGAKVIADKYQLKVQPVVLIQSSKYYDIKKFFYMPGRLTLIYMDSFVADKSNENWLKDLRVKMQKVYDDELANNPSHR
ncbi:MAG: 1-acyl-sn-glycerol-3-phosphate acyltransferase [Sulfurimonas sp.]|nr:1-acyl-sn-glycerol-3-phosphate acyltransferase [Sulfurimonas sp.]MBU3939738.1 1-acyl-sn-glycerol-3-phosphate acyltransferase [bacterium]MBU4025674.1 1-acyl-sn-glycerol-3-phosphate acyltransferase [bacterium]MBU4059682.1 1-acyl-sn-glycerol-3-phosphate acyltransferase [bacterium]MBU4110481.1 1-acyl-sn-glycerol-3-phosphate acyltransferase [bacterium]